MYGVRFVSQQRFDHRMAFGHPRAVIKKIRHGVERVKVDLGNNCPVFAKRINTFIERSNRLMFNSLMSGEISSLDHQVEVKKNPNIKVDINDLLSRVRDEKKKERKENLLFLSLIGSVIVITGIIASL